MDIIYSDVWTDAAAAGRAADASITYSYNNLSTAKPVNNASCLSPTGWDGLCRIVINYEADIHPLWALARTAADNVTDATCTSCHNGANQANAGFLDLSNNAVSQNADWFGAYSQLLQAHDEIDAAGNPVTVPGPPDANGNPTTVNVQTTPSIRAGLPSQSAFFAKFTVAANGTCPGPTQPHCTNGQAWLSPDELKLLSEWVDIGAQYYNDPFAAPKN